VAIPEHVLALVVRLEVARSEKGWKDASHLRDGISALDFEIEDTAQGPHVRQRKHALPSGGV